ncbi:hypothetical protein JCGZ_24830 [Jatropha curcas]|uniref:Uncharacterized protein n=1 Tax=Jatropha curcas TaxID=180498 RepID=A0A067KXA6_JATCU|nr:hypothetical protein JCGZ_24830 [Jatropha curcas]
MAANSLKSVLVTLFIFAMVLSPAIPSEAARLNHRDLLQTTTRPPICPACVCCEPAATPGNSPGNAYAPLVKANQVNVKCPECICCGPPPPLPTPAPSACCKCCDSHNDTHSKFGFP